MRPESVRTPPPPPLRHPHWESPRARELRRFRDEVAAAVAAADAMRRRLAAVRVLECQA